MISDTVTSVIVASDPMMSITVTSVTVTSDFMMSDTVIPYDITAYFSDILQCHVTCPLVISHGGLLTEAMYTAYQPADVNSVSRWGGSGSTVGDVTPEHQDIRTRKEAAWEEINSLKQKIKEFSVKSPMRSSYDRGLDKTLNGSGSSFGQSHLYTLSNSSTEKDL